MKKSELLERIEALEAEVESLREASNTPQVQLVRELLRPEPISQPLDAHHLWYKDHVWPASLVPDPDAEEDWHSRGVIGGPGIYL